MSNLEGLEHHLPTVRTAWTPVRQDMATLRHRTRKVAVRGRTAFELLKMFERPKLTQG